MSSRFSNVGKITRRAAVGGLAVLGFSRLMPHVRSAAATAIPDGMHEWLHDPASPPVTVPLDYLGIHSDHGVGLKTPAPSYPYDAIRSHDVDNGNDGSATQWADIEIRPGVYDWTLTDRWIKANPNKTRIWVLFGTPEFYQKYPGEQFVFPSLPGGGSPPKDPKTAARFIEALLARYRGEIDYVEIWNEPNFGPGTNPENDRWTPALNEAGWFTGSASDLAELARVVKAVLPPDVKLMAGAWAWQAKDEQLGPGNSVVRFAAAPDRGGGFGRDHVDAISVHLYTYNFDPNPTIAELRSYERLFDECGYARELPRFVSETGAWDPGMFTESEPSLADKLRIVKRWCMIPAAFGYRGVYLYKHSIVGTLGDPAAHPELSKAIGEMRDGLRGKVIVKAALMDDTSIELHFADGSSLKA